MAGDSVITTFGADDSPFQAVAKRVMQSMAQLAGFKGPPATFNAATAGMAGLQRGAARAAVSSYPT